MIVDDDGFVNQFKVDMDKVRQYAREGVYGHKSLVQSTSELSTPEDYSKPGTLPFHKLWGPEVKYSDQLANGDHDDDKELEDEDDPRDMIVDDDGFVNQFKVTDHQVRQWGREGVQGHKSLMQGEEPAEDYSKPGSKPFHKLWGPEVKYSDTLANGDHHDDKEIEDEDDPRDMITDDDGFVNQFKVTDHQVRQWRREGIQGHKSLMQGDDADDEEIEENDDEDTLLLLDAEAEEQSSRLDPDKMEDASDIHTALFENKASF